MRLEAELHMRALARKQKRDLAAQAAVGTGLAASEHGDSSTELSGGRSDFRGGGMPVKKASIFFACSQGFLLKVELPMDLPSPSKETSFRPKGWPRARGGGPRGGAISFASSKTQSCSPGGNAGRRTMATGRGAGFGVLRPVRLSLIHI